MHQLWMTVGGGTVRKGRARSERRGPQNARAWLTGRYWQRLPFDNHSIVTLFARAADGRSPDERRSKRGGERQRWLRQALIFDQSSTSARRVSSIATTWRGASRNRRSRTGCSSRTRA